MPNDLGKLVAVHGIAPAYTQRAVFIAVLSFLFFLAMMFAFYLRQNFLYFLLSTAFLIVYLVTMFSFIVQKRNAVEVFDKGLAYRKKSAAWSEISSVSHDGTIQLKDGNAIVIPSSISGFDALIQTVRGRIATFQ